MKKVGVALVIVLALCLLPLSSVKAETKADVENRLDQIEKEIAALKKEVTGQKEAWEKNLSFLKSIKLGGEVRTRWEIQNNFNFAKNNTDDFFLMRTRFSIEASPIENLKIFIEAQDARVWGDERDGVIFGKPRGGDWESQRTTADDDRLDLKQGYFELQNIGGLPIAARVGRQVLSYGDERLVGANNWSNYGRSFDALKLIIHPAENVQVDVFYSKVVETIKNNRLDEDEDVDFYGVYGTTSNFQDIGLKAFDLYCLVLRDNGLNNSGKPATLVFPGGLIKGLDADSNATIWTIGARAAGVIPIIEAIDYNIEYAHQYGQIASSSLDAWALHSEVGFSLPDFMMKPRIAAFFNYATGDAVAGDKRNTTFVNLFPTNHDKYGMIDFMRWQNMQDIGGNLTVTPIESLTAKIAYHRLWLAKKNDAWYGSPTEANLRNTFFATNSNRKGDGDNNVGDEIDLLLTYNYNKYVALEAGYSVFFAGDLIKRGGTDLTDGGKAVDNHKTEANWGYIQAKIGF